MTTRNGLIGLLIVGIGVALFCGLSTAENPQYAPVPAQYAPVPHAPTQYDPQYAPGLNQFTPVQPTTKAADPEPPVTTKDLLRRIQALENRVTALETPQPVGKLIGATPDTPAEKSPYPPQQH
jgi:hypothetical protein